MNKLIYKIVIFFLFTINANNIFCQTKDTTATIEYKDVYKYQAKNRLQCDTNCVKEDTLFLSLFRYDPVFKGNYLFASMGNIGRPHRPLFLKAPSLQYTFRTFPIEAYEYCFDNINVYNVSSPYTRLFYVSGSGKENYLSGVHAQTIKNASFGIDFRTLSSKGFYLREESNNLGGSFYVSYDNPSGKYGNFSGFTFNRNKPQENGGIAYDTLFTNNTNPDRTKVNTKLSDAQNTIKTNTLFFSQFFNPFIRNNDSILPGFNGGTFEHVFSYERKYHIFSENAPDSLNYSFFHRDSANTNDSTSNMKAKNAIYWSNYSFHLQPNKSNYLYIKAGIIHEYIESRDCIKTHYFSQFTPELIVSYNFDSKYKIGSKFSITAGGYNDRNYLSAINGYAKPWGDSSHIFSINIQQSAIQPDFFYSNYHGNNFEWNKYNLNPIYTFTGTINYKYKILEVGSSFFNIENYTFIDNKFKPIQWSPKINYIQAYTNISLRYKTLNWLINATFSNNNNDSIVAIPKFSSRQSLFLRFPMFGKKMYLQTGIDVMYVSSYFAPYYIPSLGDYVIQHTNSYGNFFYADYFIGFKIKKFNAMFKIQNVAKGLLGYTYMMMPGYPLPDRIIKLAVSWRFYD